jgi:16S rRNA (uracil1498-N3)-methyltransferase
MSDPEARWAASAGAAAHVVVAGDLDGDVVLEDEDRHHLVNVLRLREGDTITVADGSGNWRVARGGGDARNLRFHCEGARFVEPELVPLLAVAFAVTKGQKPEIVVDRLTQLGVDRIVAVTTKRSVVRWTGAQRAPKLERLRRVAREAAMQCRRARLPEIDITESLVAVAGHPGLVLADRLGDGPAALGDPGPDGWLVVVGPEGGFDSDELDVLGSIPSVAVGPHVLRAETAAVAVAAALAVRRRSHRSHAG